MSFAALSVFEFANIAADGRQYDVRIISEKGGEVLTSMGVPIGTEAFSRRHFDTLIIGGSTEVLPTSAATIAYLSRAAKQARRTSSICMGAFALAEAGILDGRRATTHWAAARELKRRFPSIHVEEDRIFVVDRGVWTSAGMSAGVDLALGMVEEDLGAELAKAVAKKLVVHHRRAGGQSQFSALLELDPKSDRIQAALEYARSNLCSALSVEQLAEAVHLSPRQFSRSFKAETGQSPAKAVEQLRLEAARLMVEQGRLSNDVIAVEAGFGDRERMRRAFSACLWTATSSTPPLGAKRPAGNSGLRGYHFAILPPASHEAERQPVNVQRDPCCQATLSLPADW
jgi:transcriptional regulator GlxA family with amidase domain